MAPLQAEISFAPQSQESRGSVRRTLRLRISVSTAENWTKALIHDLSETGLMIETKAGLEVGETILFDLPVAGPTEARVIWNHKTFFGCEFLTPVSRAAASAAMLQADYNPSDSGSGLPIDELPVGIRPSIDELQAWKTEFERTRATNGYQLIGFRQTSDGLILAIVAKTN